MNSKNENPLVDKFEDFCIRAEVIGAQLHYSAHELDAVSKHDFYVFNNLTRTAHDLGAVFRRANLDNGVIIEARNIEMMRKLATPVTLSALEQTDARSKAVQKTPWRVSLDAMKKQVASVEYIYPTSIPHMTIAIVMLKNGYALIGESAPADPANFNEKLGQEYAYENAMKKLWPLEAYVMRDYMTGAVRIDDPSERWTS